ncbi:MAG: hypothetical protein HN576_14525 [Bacteriovoracaceae bacterium]|jgi:hypothetical protein|nr:hypothetical protein [Bacteriovoracaceae bacterium]
MSNKKKDLTRIEDLKDFFHEDDAETDAALSINEDPSRTDINIDVATPEEDSGIFDISSDQSDESDVFQEEEDQPYENESDNFQEFQHQPDENDSKDTESSELFENNESSEAYDISESFLDGVETGDQDISTFDESDDNTSSEIQESRPLDNDIFSEPTQSDRYSEPPATNTQENDFTQTPVFQVTQTDLDVDPTQNETISDVLVQEQTTATDIFEEDSYSKSSTEINNIIKEQENFSELTDFAKSLTYGEVTAGGNPPFSIILKNIVYKEDAEDILIILGEHKLVDDNNQETMQEALENGSLLLSQISEYSAIYLAHKFRRFNIDVLVGLSEELHPSKSYESSDVGLTSKRNIRQNIRDSHEYHEEDVNLDSILLATTPTLQNHIISKYISIISEHKTVAESELLKETESKLDKNKGSQIFDFFDKNEDRILENISFGLDEVYKEMANLLKEKCLKLNGNAVVGINFQLTPLFSSSGDKTHINYKVTATGNVVWVASHGESIEHT